MMLKCPKCGLVQPKDQFCAQCGVDMYAFKPKGPSLSQKVFRHPGFQVTILSILVFGTYVFIRMRQETIIQQKIEAIRTAPPTRVEAPTQPDSEKVPTRQTAKSEEPSTHPQAPAPDQTLSGDQGAPSISVPSATTAQQPSKQPDSPPPVAETAPTGPRKIHILYAKATVDFVNSLRERRDVQSFSRVGSYSLYLVPAIDKKLFLGQSLRTRKNKRMLEVLRQQSVPIQDEAEFFDGGVDPTLKEPVGLRTQISPLFVGREIVQLRVFIQRSLKEYEEDEPRLRTRTFQEEFDLQAGWGAVFVGLLPRDRPIYEDETRILRGSTLQVMDDEDFINEQAEFIIVLTISKKTKL